MKYLVECVASIVKLPSAENPELEQLRFQCLVLLLSSSPESLLLGEPLEAVSVRMDLLEWLSVSNYLGGLST